jgi:serine protease Do
MNRRDHGGKRSGSMSFVAMTALSLALFAGSSAIADDAKPSVSTGPDIEPSLKLATELSGAFQRVAKDVTPAVVHITAQKNPGRTMAIDPREQEFRRFFGMPFAPPQPASSFGSGIIVSSDGYILTNNHVIEGADQLSVTMANDRQFEATLIGRDPETDVAVLKIEGSSLPFAKLGNSDQVGVGEWVLAIGNPFGLNQTVTAGIISAKGRSLPNGPGSSRDNRYDDFFQTDAAINPGNSGGALVNLKGEVIGMNTAIFSRSGGYMGIGFAVPANMASAVMDSLRSTGEVQRGWLGVGFQNLDEKTSASLGFSGEGVVVTNVMSDGPASKAGLQAEDVIVAVNGRPISSESQLRIAIASVLPGRPVAMDIFRAGKRMAITATAGKRDERAIQAAAGVVSADNELGLSVVPMTDELAESAGLRKPVGVMVRSVNSSSPGAGFIRAGDVILRIDGVEIKGIEDFQQAIKAVNIRRGVRLITLSQGQQRMITLRNGR